MPSSTSVGVYLKSHFRKTRPDFMTGIMRISPENLLMHPVYIRSQGVLTRKRNRYTNI